MNPTICWPDKTLPVEIHCAPGVLTGIEIAAADGLLAMPRFGLGVGGLLLGKRENGRIEITRSVEIACSHTLGPGFVLTPEEIEGGRTPKLTESAELANEAPDSDVVGWYCSKPSGSKTAGPLALSDHDRVLFDALCPQFWQIALLVRPNVGNTTTAAFGMREPDGFVVGEPQELEWTELHAAEEMVVETQPAPVEPEVAAIVHPEPVPDAVEMPVPVLRGGTLFGVPDSAPEKSKPKKRKWPVLIIGVILLILVAAAYFTQQFWMPFAEQHWTPRPPVALIASSNWRGRVAIVWNTQAVSDQGKGTLVIDDGAGPAHTIHLERAGLDLGLYEYDCRPGTTTVTLVTDDLSGRVTVKVAAEPYLPESGISK
jgi:hypothetical protein